MVFKFLFFALNHYSIITWLITSRKVRGCMSGAFYGIPVWRLLSAQILGLAMVKLQLTGRNLGRVFNFRSGHLHSENLWCYQSNWLKVENSVQTTFRFSPVDIVLPSLAHIYMDVCGLRFKCLHTVEILA